MEGTSSTRKTGGATQNVRFSIPSWVKLGSKAISGTIGTFINKDYKATINKICSAATNETGDTAINKNKDIATDEDDGAATKPVAIPMKKQVNDDIAATKPIDIPIKKRVNYGTDMASDDYQSGGGHFQRSAAVGRHFQHSAAVGGYLQHSTAAGGHVQHSMAAGGHVQHTAAAELEYEVAGPGVEHSDSDTETEDEEEFERRLAIRRANTSFRNASRVPFVPEIQFARKSIVRSSSSTVSLLSERFKSYSDSGPVGSPLSSITSASDLAQLSKSASEAQNTISSPVVAELSSSVAVGSALDSGVLSPQVNRINMIRREFGAGGFQQSLLRDRRNKCIFPIPEPGVTVKRIAGDEDPFRYKAW